MQEVPNGNASENIGDNFIDGIKEQSSEQQSYGENEANKRETKSEKQIGVIMKNQTENPAVDRETKSKQKKRTQQNLEPLDTLVDARFEVKRRRRTGTPSRTQHSKHVKTKAETSLKKKTERVSFSESVITHSNLASISECRFKVWKTMNELLIIKHMQNSKNRNAVESIQKEISEFIEAFEAEMFGKTAINDPELLAYQKCHRTLFNVLKNEVCSLALCQHISNKSVDPKKLYNLLSEHQIDKFLNSTEIKKAVSLKKDDTLLLRKQSSKARSKAKSHDEIEQSCDDVLGAILSVMEGNARGNENSRQKLEQKPSTQTGKEKNPPNFYTNSPANLHPDSYDKNYSQLSLAPFFDNYIVPDDIQTLQREGFCKNLSILEMMLKYGRMRRKDNLYYEARTMQLYFEEAVELDKYHKFKIRAIHIESHKKNIFRFEVNVSFLFL